MGHLLAVKERQHMTDSMFEPLQQTIALLKVYEQELPDIVYKQLEVRSRLSVTSPSLYCHVFFLFPPPAVAGTLLFLCAVQLPISSLFSGSWQFIICHSCRRCFSSPSPYLPHLSVCLSVCLLGCPSHCRSCRRSGTTCASRQRWSNSRWRRCRPSRWPACVGSAPRSMWSSTPSGRVSGPEGPSGSSRGCTACVKSFQKMCAITCSPGNRPSVMSQRAAMPLTAQRQQP